MAGHQNEMKSTADLKSHQNKTSQKYRGRMISKTNHQKFTSSTEHWPSKKYASVTAITPWLISAMNWSREKDWNRTPTSFCQCLDQPIQLDPLLSLFEKWISVTVIKRNQMKLANSCLCKEGKPRVNAIICYLCSKNESQQLLLNEIKWNLQIPVCIKRANHVWMQ